MADLALGWLANWVSVFEEVTDVKIIEQDRFPLLSAWMQEFAEVPVIKESWPPHEKLVTKFRALREPYLAVAAQPK